MLNCFAVEGCLSDDVNLTFDEAKKVAKASFHLDNFTKIGKRIYTNKFYVVVYGKLAKDCAAALSKGQKVTVSGTSNTWSKTDETGNKLSGVTIIASDVFWD